MGFAPVCQQYTCLELLNLDLEPDSFSHRAVTKPGFCGDESDGCSTWLHPRAGASPRKISQGEKQRVAVVRALVNGAELILADEPTANLESKQGLEIISFLHTSVKNDNRSVVIASHDERIMKYADRVLRLEDGALSNVNIQPE